MSSKIGIAIRVHLKPNTFVRAERGDEFCWLALENKNEFDQPILMFPPNGVGYEDLKIVAQVFNDMIAKAKEKEAV
jgi:hypothetical protein